MLDIRLIREQPDFVKSRLATRGGDDAAKIDEVLRVDTERRKAETALQQLNGDRKRLSKEIGGKRSRGETGGAGSTGARDRRRDCALERANIGRG
jgi:seryl-tRNA synthetase